MSKPQKSVQPGLDKYYLSELKQKTGDLVSHEHLFAIRGLHNYSVLPMGDSRVLRENTTTRELNIHPAHRAATAPKYDHLQAGEEKDNEEQLVTHGANSVSMEGSSIGKGGRKTMASSEARLVQARSRYYREAIEHTNAGLVDRQEKLMRDKLNQYGTGASKTGVFQLRSAFRYFDREARGAFDLDAFIKGLEFMGLEFEHSIIVAMFARYDVNRSGKIDYYGFIENVLQKDYVSKAEGAAFTQRMKVLLDHLRTEGNLDKLVRHDEAELDVHDLTDEEFLDRQRVKKIFAKMDADHNGTLDVKELRRFFALLGMREVTIHEVKAIFDFIDTERNGDIDLSEFFSWYYAVVPDKEPTSPGEDPWASVTQED